jgi:hypothetical protein
MMAKVTKQLLRCMYSCLSLRYRRKLGAVIVAIDIAVAVMMQMSGKTVFILNSSDNGNNMVATEIRLNPVNALPVGIIGICGLFLLLWPVKGSESAP